MAKGDFQLCTDEFGPHLTELCNSGIWKRLYVQSVISEITAFE